MELYYRAAGPGHHSAAWHCAQHRNMVLWQFWARDPYSPTMGTPRQAHHPSCRTVWYTYCCTVMVTCAMLGKARQGKAFRHGYSIACSNVGKHSIYPKQLRRCPTVHKYANYAGLRETFQITGYSTYCVAFSRVVHLCENKCFNFALKIIVNKEVISLP